MTTIDDRFRDTVANELRASLDEAFPDDYAPGDLAARICLALPRVPIITETSSASERMRLARLIAWHAIDLTVATGVAIPDLAGHQTLASATVAALRDTDPGPAAIAEAAAMAVKERWFDDDHPQLLLAALLESRLDLAIHLVSAAGGAPLPVVHEALWHDWTDSMLPVLWSAGVSPELCAPVGTLMKSAAKAGPVHDEDKRLRRRGELAVELAGCFGRVSDAHALLVLHACIPTYVTREGIPPPPAPDDLLGGLHY